MTLESFLRDLQVSCETHQFTEKIIMDEANTKEKRQVLLDSFFRVVCLQVISVLQSGVLKQITHVFVSRRHRSKCLQIENTCICAQETQVEMSSNSKQMYLCTGKICKNVFKQKTHVFVPRTRRSNCPQIENTCICAQETRVKLSSNRKCMYLCPRDVGQNFFKQKTQVFVPRRHILKCLQIENTCICSQETYVKMSSNRKHMYLCLGDIGQYIFKQKTHVFVPRRHLSKCLLIENTCICAQETQVKMVSSFIFMV